MEKFFKVAYKYRIATPYMIIYYLLIFVCIFFILGYLFEFLRIGFVLRFLPGLYFHVSNLCISIIFYLGIGSAWMLQGVKFRYVILLGIAVVLANVVCETLLRFLNTTDFVDAIYGIVGTVIGFAYLTAVNIYGLIPLEEKQTDGD